MKMCRVVSQTKRGNHLILSMTYPSPSKLYIGTILVKDASMKVFRINCAEDLNKF